MVGICPRSVQKAHTKQKEKRPTQRSLRKISVTSLSPVFVELSFDGIHVSVDVFTLFRFKQMLWLCFQINGMLKTCFWHIISAETREKSMFQPARCFSKSFKIGRSAIFCLSNRFPAKPHQRFMRSGLQEDFKKHRRMGQLNGPLSEFGVT